jgi:Zn-dependent metalloprotease
MLMAAAISMFTLASTTEPAELSRRSQELLQTMRKESNNTLVVQWNPATKTPATISGQLTQPSLHSPGWIAYEYIGKIKELYDLKRVKEQLAVIRIDETDQGHIVHLQRQLFKKPVCGEQLIVKIAPSGVIQRIEGTMHPQLEKRRLGRPMAPAFSKEEAKKLALASEQTIATSQILRIESCYLPDREGVPLVHQVHFEKNGRPATMTIHSLTGRIIP